MSIEIVTVDAFTDRPFHGNPAAVCVLDGPADSGWMQRLATELNLPMTAYLHRRDDGWSLRWFTPSFEEDLCGHATLAAGHVLVADGHVGPNEVARFHTLSGELRARRTDDGVELDFPATPASPHPPPDGLLAALDLPPDGVRAVGRSRFDWLVEVTDADQVRKVVPDHQRLAVVDTRGVIVTAPGDDCDGDVDVVSRFFAPDMPGDEDPVTGSAHCAIGPWWSDRLGPRLRCHQASARGGDLVVTADGERVRLAGAAVVVLRATLVT